MSILELDYNSHVPRGPESTPNSVANLVDVAIVIADYIIDASAPMIII